MTCSRPGCVELAIGVLSYDYQGSEVTVTTLGPAPDSAAYRLCRIHLDRLRVPKGWTLTSQIVTGSLARNSDEIAALAARIRQVGASRSAGDGEVAGTEHSLSSRANLVTLTTRAHLRVVADASRRSEGAARK